MQPLTRPGRGEGGFKFQFIVVSLAVVLFLNQPTGAVVIEDCGGANATAKLTYVDIGNCGEKDAYCPFVRGQNASSEFGFHTNTAGFAAAKVEVLGKFGKFSKHFPIKPDDACGNYGFNCPVGPNQDVKLKISLPIKNYYPKNILVQAVFKLLDESKQIIFCVSFPAKIVDK